MFPSREQKLNPFPLYARVRREQPVAYTEAAHAWCVFRYDDVRMVMQNHAVCSSNNTDIVAALNMFSRRSRTVIIAHRE